MAKSDRRLGDSFRVGRWLADRNALTLTCEDSVEPLEPRAFEVLRYLAERPGKLVTIDELEAALWPDVAVTPNAVTRTVAELTKALGNHAQHTEYVETVARSGYRLVAPVQSATPRRRLMTAIAAGGAAIAMLIVGLSVWTIREVETDPSIAVLPFDNLTGDAALDYIGDGVAEEVIDALARIDGLKVTARYASFRLREPAEDLREIAERLGVAYLVEGSVRQSGEKLRVTAQLIEAASGHHVWSRTAEHDVLDIHAVQDAVSDGLAGALAKILGLPDAEAPTRRAREPHPEAYNLYLRGRHAWHRRGSEDLQPAIDSFAEAVKIDPDFARGWAALASAYLARRNYSLEGRAAWSLAENAARRALALDPGIPESYGVLGAFAQRRHQWVEAARLFEKGLELDPRSPMAHFWFSEHLATTGRVVESAAHLKEALKLDPTYLAPQGGLGFAYLHFGDYANGDRQFRTVWRRGFRNPNSWIGSFLSRILMKNYDAATDWIDESPVSDTQKTLLQRFVAVEAGRTDDPTLLADILADSSLDHRLVVWTGLRLGGSSQVADYLERRLAKNQYVDPRPLWWPGTALHREPAFVDLMDTFGLVDYWQIEGFGPVCRQQGAGIVCDASALTPERLHALLAGDAVAD